MSSARSGAAAGAPCGIGAGVAEVAHDASGKARIRTSEDFICTPGSGNATTMAPASPARQYIVSYLSISCTYGPVRAPPPPVLRRRRRGAALRPGRAAAQHRAASTQPADPAAGTTRRHEAAGAYEPAHGAD